MKTVKLEGYQPTGPPEEGSEVQWWREWLVRIIFGLWKEKKDILAKRGWTARPIHQKEVLREVKRRVAMLKEEKLWGTCKEYRYSKMRGHNWIERRVNECATEEFGPKTDEGVLKIVNVTAGLYAPNPELFK